MNSTPPIGSRVRTGAFWALTVLTGWVALKTQATELHVRWTAAGAPLVHGETRLTNSVGQIVSFTRTDVILSAIALHRPGTGWITHSNWVGVFQGNSTTGVVLA